jgi:hypothetical protein
LREGLPLHAAKPLTKAAIQIMIVRPSGDNRSRRRFASVFPPDISIEAVWCMAIFASRASGSTSLFGGHFGPITILDQERADPVPYRPDWNWSEVARIEALRTEGAYDPNLTWLNTVRSISIRANWLAR